MFFFQLFDCLFLASMYDSDGDLLGMVTPFKGQVSDPPGESKGHGLNHLVVSGLYPP